LATVLVVNQEAAVRDFLEQAGLRVVEVQLGEPVVTCTNLSDLAGIA
jgi:L-lactate utilization protein LutB